MRRILLWTLVVLTLLIAAGGAYLLLRPKDESSLARLRPEAMPSVKSARAALVTAFGTNGTVRVRELDVRRTTARTLYLALKDEPGDMLLWMPGSHDWLLVDCGREPSVSLADMIDRVVETDPAGGFPGLFSSYVGRLSEVIPAFEGLAAEWQVEPEHFVTKEIPKLDWLDASGVDADIRTNLLAEIRSMQVVRRVILEGNILAAKGELEQAVATWGRAARRNPADPFLLERLESLRTNAEVFRKLGKNDMAERCDITHESLRSAAGFKSAK